MKYKSLVSAGVIWCLGTVMCWGQASVENILPLDGHIAANGKKVELTWFEAASPRVGSVTVKRRHYGQIGGNSWQTVGSELGPVMHFVDESIEPGIAYEYQVLRHARDIVDVGYWVAGVDLPARTHRGTAYVIVDETIAEAIAPRLARFESDLTGDGWTVLRHLAPRNDTKRPLANLETAYGIRAWLNERYVADPFGQHAAILVGHVPIVKSGRVNPDGHNPVPHATDLFYADVDGRWRALRAGVLMDNQVPGDFIEMQVGRIDFANLSSGKRKTEVHLLQAYLDKNHHWRMGFIGDLRTAYGSSGHLIVETYGLRNIVGPQAITEGGHHDVGENSPWLWGISSGDRKGRVYAEKYANKAVFALNFGSGKQKFDNRGGPMTALLAQPWYTLAVGWGARPAWWPHHMALGGTIGKVHFRTVNNGSASKPYRETMDYYPTGKYLWRNPIWVNLLGDPTLRPFMLAPATLAAAQQTDQGMAISWDASTDPGVTGYRVYRAAPESLEFEALKNGAIIKDLQFMDDKAPTGARYMIRAHGLKRVYAGSFYTLSQGTFAQTDTDTSFKKDFTVVASSGQTVLLPKEFSSVKNGAIFAFVEGAPVGQLNYGGTDWHYTPPDGFSGDVTLRFSVSNALNTVEGFLTIEVGD